MSKDKEKKVGKEQSLLEAARLGQFERLESILNQLKQLKAKKRTNPLSSLRKTLGLNNIRDPVTGFTCLHHSSLNGHSECVRLLLEHGAKPNALDYKGSSALHLASWADNLDVVRILLGAESFLPASSCSDEQQQQPSQVESIAAATATAAGQQPLALVDIDLCNNDNQTPLSLAAQFGHHNVVRELLAHGANANIRNSQLESPLDLACLNGRLETVDLLLKSSSADYPAQAELQRPRSSLVQPQRQSQFCHSPLAATSNSGSSSSTASSTSSCSSGGGGETAKQVASSSTHRRPSAGSGTWSSLLMRTKSQDSSRAADSDQPQPPGSFAIDRRRLTLSSLDTSSMMISGKQLDHSPLHYAIRRGHLDVIKLLLYKYNANLLQTTTRGSVLHEIATNNFGCYGKHGEILALLFEYIRITVPKENRDTFLDRFFNLKNAQMKNVFQVLNEINNRSAQEIKRLIYELGEKINNNDAHDDDDNSSDHREKQPTGQVNKQQLANNMRQFSDAQQINSFLTMKRAPKSGAAVAPSIRQQQQQPILNGTQTIDRSYQPKYLQQQQLQQQQQQQQQLLQFQMYQPIMTRSVSNLTRVSANYQQQQQQLHEQAYSGQHLTRQQQQQQQQLAYEQHSKRSKSRDFGSLLMEAKQDHLYDNIRAPLKAAQLWQKQQQQQQQLVRSQTDCYYLMGTTGGDGNDTSGQEHRKMINRHYHVYDHEFYPPRLSQQQQPQPQQPAPLQLQPIVPAMPAKDPMLNPAFRSSTRSNASSRVQRARATFEGRQPDQQQQQQQQQQQVIKNSRLSLNMDSSHQVQVQQQQQLQMDRFLARHSKKLNPIEQNRCASVEQKRRDLELEQQQQQQQQWQRQQLQLSNEPKLSEHQRRVQSSCSLESHLSEPQLFDTTRRAIMRDFDEMIGRELLNRRDSSHATLNGDGDGGKQMSGSRSSILTGVMLDMDRYGDRLTVSGTIDETPRGSSETSSCNSEPLQLQQRQVIYDLPARSQLSIDETSLQQHQQQQPPRPPQPRQRTSAARLANRSQTIAIDQAAASGAGLVPAGQIQPPSRAALTEPPKVRPPPPPVLACPSLAMASPLHVLAPASCEPQPAAACSPSTSNEQLGGGGGGLLKMASITSNSSSSSGSTGSSSIIRLALPRRGKGQNYQLAPPGGGGGGDQDSGVCTSISPASLGHESETNHNQFGDQTEQQASMDNSPTDLNAAHGGHPTSSAAVVMRQTLNRDRAAQSPDCGRQENPVAAVAPPSPKTAQMCIEQALGYIETDTHEAANQTSSLESSPARPKQNVQVKTTTSIGIMTRPKPTPPAKPNWLVANPASSC